MKFLITGGSGFFGTAVTSYLNQNHDVIALYLNNKPHLAVHSFSADIRDANRLREIFQRTHPDVVVHLAAISSVDYCEKNRNEAYEVNVIGTRNVVENADRLNAKTIYISTDLVFGADTKSFYTEADPPAPTSYYSQTKFLAEREVSKSNSAIIRPSWMYGVSRNGESFFVKMIRNFATGTPVNLHNNVYRTPIYIHNLAQIIEDVALQNLTGIWHAGGLERLSMYEFGWNVCEALGFDKTLCISTKRTPNELYAHRPEDCSLDSQKLQKALENTHLMSVKEALETMKDRL
jgi:dTDP-4-dehydrorhamnose reductase